MQIDLGPASVTAATIGSAASWVGCCPVRRADAPSAVAVSTVNKAPSASGPGAGRTSALAAAMSQPPASSPAAQRGV